MKNLIFISFLFVVQINFAQQPKIFKIKKFEVATLSDSLKENSGLNFFNNQLFTFNDGGNSSELFHLDIKKGKILKKFTTNLQNKDWEALTNDGTNFYIGDFGNNDGTRKDLKIYKLELDSGNSAKTISFYYPEQKDFTPKNLNNDFDAEAMIYLDGKIHLFTKEWKAKATTHYTLDPENFELQEAKKTETFRTRFLVTDAFFFERKLYLIGYTKKTEVFLQIFQVSEGDYFFTKPSKKYYLGSALSLSQIEGIAVNKDGVYISGENFISPFGILKAKFYFIPDKYFD